ncbi:RNA 2',3'-cyclic phosphodiesterase [Micromonospora sp. WMMD1102]|uniref:RNA 2',3'-cyclic phosphodiesterase n=1 Tax=Micromonospora sp. WMMD1102 TaxID=3016105 RepID=UPI0024151330|nr:RNA 2',3'-cyclic phosphodiesterase [Micromonospora sp. WMMD1102]MDG4790337.1 RNA 2',3'-cyclic phosphodiesterase [Micromonospora sp. WMMD1102]
MRLFVAVYPPPEAVHDIVAQVHRLRIGAAARSGVNVRLTAPSTLHVTVAFLGEVPDERLPVVEEALSRVETSGGLRAPRLRFGGGGRFGRGRFTVLWVGLRGEVDVLRRLGATVRRELRRARIPFDVRPLRPHLTLARPGERIDPGSLDEDLSTLDGYLGPSWPATELVLVRSQLGPRPTYDRLASWPL